MKIIFDNIIFSLQNAGGGSLYWYEIIKGMLKKNLDISFYEKENTNIFSTRMNITAKNNESILPAKILRYLPFIRKIPSKAIFHSSDYRFSTKKSIINILTVHDFTYEFYRKGIPKYLHSFQKKLAIKNADGIICVSNNTKQDLLKFYPELNNSSKIINVIHNGVSNGFYPLENINNLPYENKFEKLKNKKFIIFIGHRTNYKNFDLAVKTVSKLKNYYLLIISGGSITSSQQEQLDSYLNKRFFYFSSLTEPELNYIYNLAFCLLYPSSYEGFGIPIIEAMQAGCPVVTTNKSSIPEVAGNAALIAKDLNVNTFVKLIKELDDFTCRTEVIKRGFMQSKKFSWEKCVTETYNFYQEISKIKY